MTRRWVTLFAVVVLVVTTSVAGVAQQESIEELRARAETGDADAQHKLGIIYKDGTRRQRQNTATAVRWFRLARDQGHIPSLMALGRMYGSGDGVPRDDAEAVRLFRLAADQGYGVAQSNVGMAYAYGRGVRQNEVEATRWLRMAANQGIAMSQLELGFMYGNGKGVPQDYVRAHMWSNLVASSTAFGILRQKEREKVKEQALKNRNIFELQMSRGQLAEAQRLAREWSPSVNAGPDGLAPPIGDADPSEFRGGTGTAFIVDPSGVLLTAHHVVDQATSITVSCNGRAPVAVTVTSSSPAVDLAVLTAVADLGTNTYLELSPSQLALGDNVFTIGYPTPALLGRDPKYTNGTVSALSGVGGDASFLQISVPVQPGNSGGPLVNEQGEVIGVVVATADAPAFLAATDSIPQNINWAVKSVFASALFTPPAGSAVSTVDREDVIAHVTEATCLVDVTGAAR